MHIYDGGPVLRPTASKRGCKLFRHSSKRPAWGKPSRTDQADKTEAVRIECLLRSIHVYNKTLSPLDKPNDDIQDLVVEQILDIPACSTYVLHPVFPWPAQIMTSSLNLNSARFEIDADRFLAKLDKKNYEFEKIGLW